MVFSWKVGDKLVYKETGNIELWDVTDEVTLADLEAKQDKLTAGDRYLEWQELTAVDNEAEFDFNVSDKYYIDTASEITLDIPNAPDGFVGL